MMTDQGWSGFTAGERVIVREHSWGRASRRGVVLGLDVNGRLLVRMERDPAPAPLAPTVVFHDTAAFYSWLDAEIPPGGAAPTAAFGHRRNALAALWADNPHLDGQV
jgi:hypothetical protein